MDKFYWLDNATVTAEVEFKGYQSAVGYVREVERYGVTGIEVRTMPASDVRCDSSPELWLHCTRCGTSAGKACSPDALQTPHEVQWRPGDTIYAVRPCTARRMRELVRERYAPHPPTVPAESREVEICRELLLAILHAPGRVLGLQCAEALRVLGRPGGPSAWERILEATQDPLANSVGAPNVDDVRDRMAALLEEFAATLDEMPF